MDDGGGGRAENGSRKGNTKWGNGRKKYKMRKMRKGRRSSWIVWFLMMRNHFRLYCFAHFPVICNKSLTIMRELCMWQGLIISFSEIRLITRIEIHVNKRGWFWGLVCTEFILSCKALQTAFPLETLYKFWQLTDGWIDWGTALLFLKHFKLPWVVLTHCAEMRWQPPASILKWQPDASLLF